MTARHKAARTVMTFRARRFLPATVGLMDRGGSFGQWPGAVMCGGVVVKAAISVRNGRRSAPGREGEHQDAEKCGKPSERPDVPRMDHATSSFG